MAGYFKKLLVASAVVGSSLLPTDGVVAQTTNGAETTQTVNDSIRPLVDLYVNLQLFDEAKLDALGSETYDKIIKEQENLSETEIEAAQLAALSEFKAMTKEQKEERLSIDKTFDKYADKKYNAQQQADNAAQKEQEATQRANDQAVLQQLSAEQQIEYNKYQTRLYNLASADARVAGYMNTPTYDHDGEGIHDPAKQPKRGILGKVAGGVIKVIVDDTPIEKDVDKTVDKIEKDADKRRQNEQRDHDRAENVKTRQETGVLRAAERERNNAQKELSNFLKKGTIDITGPEAAAIRQKVRDMMKKEFPDFDTEGVLGTSSIENPVDKNDLQYANALDAVKKSGVSSDTISWGDAVASMEADKAGADKTWAEKENARAENRGKGDIAIT